MVWCAVMARPFLVSVLITIFWAVFPVSTTTAGQIQGRVLMTGEVPAATKRPVTIDQYVCGTEKEVGDLVVSPAREVRNVVVWLETPPPGAPSRPLPNPAEMDQKECLFVPRVVLVPARGTVQFLNSDRLLHNLHSTPKQNPSFNRTQPKGRTIPIAFANPEIIRLDCDLHSWMRGWVVVADHPFYAMSDGQGRFRLDDVPPGQYTLQIWHERLGRVSRPLTVTADAATPVTIELPLR